MATTAPAPRRTTLAAALALAVAAVALPTGAAAQTAAVGATERLRFAETTPSLVPRQTCQVVEVLPLTADAQPATDRPLVTVRLNEEVNSSTQDVDLCAVPGVTTVPTENPFYFNVRDEVLPPDNLDLRRRYEPGAGITASTTTSPGNNPDIAESQIPTVITTTNSNVEGRDFVLLQAPGGGQPVRFGLAGLTVGQAILDVFVDEGTVPVPRSALPPADPPQPVPPVVVDLSPEQGEPQARFTVTFVDPPVATATPTASTTPAPSASTTTSPAPSGTPTPTPTHGGGGGGSPSPGVTNTAQPGADCAVTPSVTVDPAVIQAGTASTVRVEGTPSGVIELLAYTRPSTRYRVVRRAEAPASGELAFTVVPPRNTRLFARQVGCRTASASRVVGVRTALSMTAQRVGVRTYRFYGSTLPRRAGQLVNVYRRAGGRLFLSSQVRTGSGGQYTLTRRFTGSGTFDFLARTASDTSNVGGQSAPRRVPVR